MGIKARSRVGPASGWHPGAEKSHGSCRGTGIPSCCRTGCVHRHCRLLGWKGCWQEWDGEGGRRSPAAQGTGSLSLPRFPHVKQG